MYPILLHIYGPLAIHSYGVMIALGLCVFSWCVLTDPRRKNLISKDLFITLLINGIFIAALGGKLLFFLHNWEDLEHAWQLFAFWQGGFSILGSIIAIALTMPWYLMRSKIPVLPFLDLIALYTPLLQSISRIGCLLAGCCYGTPTDLPWAIAIQDEFFLRHPTQIYSSLCLLGIFFFLYKARPLFTKPGILGATYLILVSAERFFLDILRADQRFAEHSIFSFLSFNQWTALLVATGAAFFIHYLKRSSTRESLQLH